MQNIVIPPFTHQIPCLAHDIRRVEGALMRGTTGASRGYTLEYLSVLPNTNTFFFIIRHLYLGKYLGRHSSISKVYTSNCKYRNNFEVPYKTHRWPTEPTVFPMVCTRRAEGPQKKGTTGASLTAFLNSRVLGYQTKAFCFDHTRVSTRVSSEYIPLLATHRTSV